MKNLAKILRDCPRGTKLYSPLFGEVAFCSVENIEDGSDGAIVVLDPQDPFYPNGDLCRVSFSSDGRWFHGRGECMLFPSKENRDWSTFKSSKKKYEFKPFDKVLFRDYGYVWSVGFFSHKTTELGGNAVSYNIGGFNYDECIPYEGNEHLLGTTNSPDKKGGKK